MTKSLLISIQPQHLLNILNGDKTYEVRKVVPKWVLDKLDKDETVEAYLYCTKPKKRWSVGHMIFFNDELYRTPKGEIKYGSSVELMAYDNCDKNNYLSGKIPVKVVIDGYVKLEHQEFMDNGYEDPRTYAYFYEDDNPILKEMCLTHDELENYANGKDLYALHISKVEILDEVMELDDFYRRIDGLDDNGGFKLDSLKDGEHVSIPQLKKKYLVSRPPQSFMTVWVK